MRRQSESVTDFTDLKFLMDTLVRLLGADLSILSKFTKIFWGDYSRQLLFLFFVGGLYADIVQSPYKKNDYNQS